ncbi:MAG: circadian clock protein KaiC [Thermoplasmata archaeon]|nr:circadian clock protein KaiC [Thermoplasmata archaeon]
MSGTRAGPAPLQDETTATRCATGIEGLDNILGGGIPRGNMVLMAGGVGTGKTTLCLEFLVRGAEKGEKGLFISVTEASTKLMQNFSTFEFFRPDLVQHELITIVDLPIIYDRLGLSREELKPGEVDILVRTIQDLVRESGARRVVVDSLTSVGFRVRSEEKARDFILKLGQAFSDLGTTSLMVAEVGAVPGVHSLYGVEEAIVDGVVMLSNVRRRGDLLRVLQVIKMRGTVHSRAQYVIELTPIGMLMAPFLKGGRLET